LVDPNLVPGGDLDAEAIEDAARNLRRDASAVREGAGRVAGAWQGLGACYEAPETDQVLRSLDPVTAGAGRIADNLEQVASALDRFAADVRGIGDKRRVLMADMHDLRRQAANAPFTGGGFGGGMPGMVPPELAIQNAALANRSTALASEIDDAERDCARKIEAVGAPATWGQNAWNWAGDVVGGIGNSLGEAAREAKDAWDASLDRAGETLRSVGEWFNNRIGDIATGVDHGRQWIGDRAADLGDWYDDTAQDVSDWYTETEEEFLNWSDDLLRRLPRTSEVIAGELMKAGNELADVPIPGWENRVFDDGRATAGEPVPVEFDTDLSKHELIRDLAGISGGLDATYEDAKNWPGRERGKQGLVRVETHDAPDGPRVIVSVPGTMEWSPMAGDNPMDLTSDLSAMNGSGQSTITDAVRLAMENANIPKDAQVLMTGHSLGGIAVASLLEDPDFAGEYNVTHAMTFGSPIDAFEIDSGMHVMQVGHKYDSVHRVDLGDRRVIVDLAPRPDRGPNQHRVIMDSTELPWQGTMSHENYTKTMVEKRGDPRLAAWEQELRDAGFLLPAGSDGTQENVKVEYVPVGREFD
jgi:hypothetical protein